MTKLFCDNCGAETDFRCTPDYSTYRLKPSNIEMKVDVKTTFVDSEDGKPDICVNCWLTALHGAFKQPEPTNANTK